MKAKTKLIATLMAMCLVITLGVFGILAVKTLNMSVGGNITFNAEGVAFTIGNGAFFKTDKTTKYTNITTQTGKMTGFSMNTNTKLTDVEDEIESWTGLQLALDSQGDAVLKFNIKNDMTDKELYVMFTVSHGTNTNDNMNIVCVTSEKLAASANKDIYITFDILDDTINAGLTGFKIDLNICEPVQVNATTGVVEGANKNNTKYSSVKYNLNTTSKTASATKASDSISGEVVIMDRVYSGGQEYTTTIIEEDAFYYTSITKVKIPNTIIHINNTAFSWCTSLESITIPNSVVSIGDNSFSYSNLKSVQISNNITQIGSSAFSENSNLESITIKAIIPPTIGNYAFETTNGCPIYVPAGSVSAYQNDTTKGWNFVEDSRIQAIPA